MQQLHLRSIKPGFQGGIDKQQRSRGGQAGDPVGGVFHQRANFLLAGPFVALGFAYIGNVAGNAHHAVQATIDIGHGYQIEVNDE